MARRINLVGNKYGKLTVIEETNKRQNRNVCYLCKCDCGKNIIVNGSYLQKGNRRSCGCLYFNNKNGLKHNLSKSKIYKVYYSMISRCNNKNDKAFTNYGGRGIKVCDEWAEKKNGFLNFYNWAIENGYSENLTIDRINVNGNYEPSNCRWVNIEIQQNNKTNNHYIEFKNETKTLQQWSNIYSIPTSTLYYRLKNNWAIEEAFGLKKRRK